MFFSQEFLNLVSRQILEGCQKVTAVKRLRTIEKKTMRMKNDAHEDKLVFMNNFLTNRTAFRWNDYF